MLDQMMNCAWQPRFLVKLCGTRPWKMVSSNVSRLVREGAGCAGDDRPRGALLLEATLGIMSGE